MMKRSQQSYATKDKGDKYGSFFKSTPGISFWKCGEGEHTIDILSWPVGSQFPSVEQYHNVKEGDFAYVLDLWVHRKVGMDENSHACPLKNWGERCPICEDLVELARSEDVDEETIKNKKAKRRSIYYMVCYDSDAQEAKGVQIWEVSHVYMEKIIASRAKLPKGGGTVLFAMPTDEGKQIFFRRSGTGMTSTEYTDHQFLDRDYEIPDEVWMDLTPLDELIKKPTYEELYEDHFGIPYEEGNTSFRTSPTEKPKVTPTRRTRTPVQSKKEDAAKEPAKEEAPKTKTRIMRKKVTPKESAPAKEEPPAGEPAKEETAPVGDEECPGGGVFGQDIDTLDHCSTCEKWDDCAVRKNELDEQG